MNNQFEMDCDDEFLIVSVPMYKFFLANGKEGLDALLLYNHLVFTSRVQGSKKVKANLNYIKNGLGWGVAKVKKARRFLSIAGLIEFDQIRESGQFEDKKIIIKRSWDAQSVREWLEKKSSQNKEEKFTGGSEIEPSVNEIGTVGSKSDPVEHIACSESEDAIYPEVQKMVSPSTVRTVSSDNYKGSYKKRKGGDYNSKVITNCKEDTPPEADTEPSPPEVSKTEKGRRTLFQEISNKIRKVVGPEFSLSKRTRDNIRALHETSSPEYILDIVDTLIEEKQRRASAWLPHYADNDLRERVDWILRQRTTNESKGEAKAVCPCCGMAFLGTNTVCKCGFEKQDIENPDAVQSHRDWLENRQKISPFKLEEGILQIKISDKGSNFTAEIQIKDKKIEVTKEKGLSSNSSAICLLWDLIKEKIAHKARHSSGMHYTVALMHISRHIEEVNKLPDDVFYPKQGGLFDEAM